MGTYAACIAQVFYPFALHWTRQGQSQNLKRLRASSPTLWNSQRVGQPQLVWWKGGPAPHILRAKWVGHPP